MRKNLWLFLLIFWGVSPGLCSAKKPWPIFTDIEVKFTVQNLSKGWKYLYTLVNPAKNTLSVYRFQVDLRMDENNLALGLCRLPKNLNGSEYRRIFREAEKVNTAEIFAPKSDWVIGYPGLWWSRDLDIKSMVKPGEMLSGFAIVSDLPVGVRKFVSDGYDFDFSENPEDFEFKGALQELHFASCRTGMAVGNTVAPISPPEPFVVRSWTIRMTEFAVEARKQNWIKTDKVLAEIKRLISALNTGNIEKLKASVKKTEAYVLAEKKKGNLTDEADALVRLNAQYLLRRVANPGEKSDESAKK